jgi:putative tricarboxylic transport membrane protein
MESLRNLWFGFEQLVGTAPLLIVTAGVVLGIMFGAMPGLSPAMAIALLVPFTYGLDPMLAITLLAAVHLASDFGGSITAVTINTPGTPGSVATTFDGYALTRAGKPGIGLGVSLVASTVGGICGTLMLVFLSQPLANLALMFKPAHYFAICVLGLTSVATVGSNQQLRALMMAGLGLVLNSVGFDPISGVSRFSYGVTPLYEGFALIPTMIGLFAISEILVQVEAGHLQTAGATGLGTAWPKLVDYWRLRWTMVRATLVGALVGILPGAGRSIAGLMAYDVEKRISRDPASFGHGNPAGVAAAEAANSSCIGGDMVPMLALGIPGSASTAVMMGALMIHNVVPGPRLIQTHPRVVYGLFASQLLANLMILLLGLWGTRLWVRVTQVPKPWLFTLIPAAAAVGCLSIRSSLFDVGTCFGFGIVGWQLRRSGYPIVPIVLGLVLGTLIEENFRQAVLMDGYAFVLHEPLSAVILAVAALLVVAGVMSNWRRRMRA